MKSALLSLFTLLAVAGCSTISGPIQTPAKHNASLTVVYPLEDRELVGGQPLRVTTYLMDHEDQPVEGASVEAELWSPDGETFATLACADQSQGRYLADSLQLPLRDAAGVWRLVARARWGDGQQAHRESTFKVKPSFSEELKNLYGFWIDTASPLFDYYTTNIADPDSKYHPYHDENGGLVLLANTRLDQSHENFVILDVHWRHADFPEDGAAAIAYVGSLAGPHLMTLDIPGQDLATSRATFQGRPAWRVTGRWKSTTMNDNPPPGGLIEWMVFRCPGTDWLWALVIATNQKMHMGDLRALRDTFECPSVSAPLSRR